MDTAIAFVLGLIVTAGVLLPRLLRLRRGQEDMDERVVSLERGHKFLTGFLTGYPYDARQLYAGARAREIPGLLAEVVRRRLKPAKTLVLVRRESASGSSVAKACLAVAAVDPEDRSIPLGTEIPIDAGELGLVTEAQLVMDRRDLDSEEVAGRVKPEGTLGKLRPDIVAPIVFERQALGLIVLYGLRQTSPEVKAAVGLIAQTGAQAFHYAVHYSKNKAAANVDEMTGIHNKGSITRHLSDAVYQAACAAYDGRSAVGPRSGDPSRLSVFLFDIDQFKHYNDSHGHPAGDRLLTDLSRLVQATIRKDDTFGRFGGEEFLVVFHGTTQSQGLIAAEKVRSKIAGHKFSFAEQQPLGCLSVSGGVAGFPEDGDSAASLISLADQALYRAKQAGRNKVLPAVPQDNPQAATPTQPMAAVRPPTEG